MPVFGWPHAHEKQSALIQASRVAWTECGFLGMVFPNGSLEAQQPVGILAGIEQVMGLIEAEIALGERQPVVMLGQPEVDRVDLDRIDIGLEEVQEFLPGAVRDSLLEPILVFRGEYGGRLGDQPVELAGLAGQVHRLPVEALESQGVA